jgi:hypothetical protein
LAEIRFNKKQSIVINVVERDGPHMEPTSFEAVGEVITEMVTKFSPKNIRLRRCAVREDEGKKPTETFADVRERRFAKAQSPLVVILEEAAGEARGVERRVLHILVRTETLSTGGTGDCRE